MIHPLRRRHLIFALLLALAGPGLLALSLIGRPKSTATHSIPLDRATSGR